MSSYVRGRRFEYRVRDKLESEGWWVARQSRSSFPDLIAVKKGQVLLVECKSNREDLRSFEREELRRLAENLGAKALLAWKKGGKIEMEEVNKEC